MVLVDIEMPTSCGECEASGTSVCKKWATNPDLKVVSPECPVKTEITEEEYRMIMVHRGINERMRKREELRKRLNRLPDNKTCDFDIGMGPACTEDGEYLVGGEPDDYYNRRD